MKNRAISVLDSPEWVEKRAAQALSAEARRDALVVVNVRRYSAIREAVARLRADFPL
jgi:hypothetical protein